MHPRLTIKNQFALRAGRTWLGPQKPDSCTTYLDAEDLKYRVSRAQKGIVGVGSGGRNRAELVDKYKSDGIDGSGGHSSDFHMIF